MSGGEVSGAHLRKRKPPTLPNQAMSPRHGIFPQDKDGPRSSEMILDPTSPNINGVPLKEVEFSESPSKKSRRIRGLKIPEDVAANEKSLEIDSALEASDPR